MNTTIHIEDGGATIAAEKPIHGHAVVSFSEVRTETCIPELTIFMDRDGIAALRSALDNAETELSREVA